MLNLAGSLSLAPHSQPIFALVIFLTESLHSNCKLPDLHLPGNWDFRHVPPCMAGNILNTCFKSQKRPSRPTTTSTCQIKKWKQNTKHLHPATELVCGTAVIRTNTSQLPLSLMKSLCFYALAPLLFLLPGHGSCAIPRLWQRRTATKKGRA